MKAPNSSQSITELPTTTLWDSSTPPHIFRSTTEPMLENQSWDERWKSHDKGLIACWESGRQKGKEDSNLALLARKGELVILPWKGGIEKATKLNHKYGSLFYLAMWQGLRGDNLDIFTDKEAKLVCSRTSMSITFTGDQSKFLDE